MNPIDWLNANQGFAEFGAGVSASLVALLAIWLSRRDARAANERAAAAEARERETALIQLRIQAGAFLSIVPRPDAFPLDSGERELRVEVFNIGAAYATNVLVLLVYDGSDHPLRGIGPSRATAIAPGEAALHRFHISDQYVYGPHADVSIHAYYEDPMGRHTQVHHGMPAHLKPPRGLT